MKMLEKIKKLPPEPGVYIFKDKSGAILYIGKAISLKNRVRSYFSGRHEARISKMISQINDLSIRKTESVLEALILEANLIKKYQPKYNIEKKDDKSFSYFAVTKGDYPSIEILRETDIKKEKNRIKKTFGPYTSTRHMRIALKIIQKIFPFHAISSESEKGCLDYQIGKCPGPYDGKISKREYIKNISSIKTFLRGNKKSLIKKLEREMKLLSERQEFEKAAEVRNKIFSLKHIQDTPLLIGEKKDVFEKKYPRIEAFDISNISGKFAVGSMVVFEGGAVNKSQYRKFKIKTVDGSDDIGMMKEVLERRMKNKWPKPDLILVDGGRGHFSMAKKVLNGFNVSIAAVAKGKDRNKNEVILEKKFLSEKIKEIIRNRNMIKEIMDEAHRFAISYHRKIREKLEGD